jgi:hypothetical protein
MRYFPFADVRFHFCWSAAAARRICVFEYPVCAHTCDKEYEPREKPPRP